MSACEGCGSKSNIVFSEKWQTTWCAQPSGCNTDSYTSKQENFDDPASNYILDYDEVFEDDDG